MDNTDPITRLYHDLSEILKSLVIKYPNEAESCENINSKAAGDKYINAYFMRDNYFSYRDYSTEDYLELGVTDLALIEQYVSDSTLLPSQKRSALLDIRRKRLLREYEDQNDYYRMLYGYPSKDDTKFFYVTPELSGKLNIPVDIPLHKIADELGTFFINALYDTGYIDQLIAEYPEKPYLKYLGNKRIPIEVSRPAKSFAVLSVNQGNVMEATYREFTKCYERCRNYFMSCIYVYQYRKLIPYYDNFIALCIFIMAVQQVSMYGIRNAMDREFYDEYMVRLIYETYKVPFFSRADQATQKLIVQNINLLIQRKATNKVFLDLASILGFNEISIYQYYLVRQQKFDKDGRPIIAKKQQVNINTGKPEIVYDKEKMYGVHFQKVDICEDNVKDALTKTLNRVEYSDITYYDPLWWEDDELHSEIWDTAYNYMETKYFGVTIPYRLTELLLQSTILLRMIMEKSPELLNVGIQLPKISTKEFNISLVVVLFMALMSKKLGATGQITTLPSKLIHILEITDQVINKETDHMEVLQFDFDAFSPEHIKETMDILRSTLTRRKYRVVHGHDVDLREDGTQDTFAPTHMIQWSIDTTDLDELEKYINELTIPNGSKKDKIEALNKIYENIEAIYYFLSYQMSLTMEMEDYEAIKKFYDVAFYSRETAEMYKVTDEDGVERCAETFEEYLYYKDIDLYEFVINCPEDKIYEYLDHIIYKLEEYIHHVDYLHVLNSDYSPLAELLQILLNFFKSYILDFVQMSSLMIIDWDMENTLRFFDEPHYVWKKNMVIDNFGKSYSDVINRYIARIRREDFIKLKDYLEAHGNIHISDRFSMDDPIDISAYPSKLNMVVDQFSAYDVSHKTTERIYLDDNLNLSDAVVHRFGIVEKKQDSTITCL